jgi:hypothetical protein
MNFKIDERTILKIKHGSHAYGLNTPMSDLDIKGVAIEPLEYHLGFMHVFEQFEHMGSKDGSDDVVIYSLKKFAKLAAGCNPNIIEILFGEESDILFIDESGEELRANRDLFLSRKARFTFAGYAYAQLKRIKSHREWLLNPPKAPPKRSDYGLGETMVVNASDLGAFESLIDKKLEIDMPKDVLTMFVRERSYRSAKTHYDQYVNWTKTRNVVRGALEAKSGYDTKHAMHLIRLMRMCKEIMSLGKVIVKRHDRDELLAIRDGLWTYEKIVDHAETLEKECTGLYETSTCLPHHSDCEKLDRLIVDITEKYLKKHG